MTLTEEVKASVEAYMKSDAETRAATTFLGTMMLLDKLETREERVDIVNAGVNFLRGIFLREFLKLITDNGRAFRLPPEHPEAVEELIEAMKRLAVSFLEVDKFERTNTERFLTMCEMFPKEFLVRTKDLKL